MHDLEPCLVGHWIHSHEEDTAETRVYRRAGYKFPPARGRQGFELRDGGEAVIFGLAPADGSRQATARWTRADQRITIAPAGGPGPTLTFDIVSCDDEALRVAR